MEMTPNPTQDRLSNLPDGILENIFSSLSTKDVVKTSILSTTWRYKWISSPYLVFNDECLPDSFGGFGHSKLVEIVNHVLLTHRGRILTFKISSSKLETCPPEINSWILRLPSVSLTELEILFTGYFCPYSVPPSFFSFKHLTDLTLSDCIIPVPPLTFEGFRCLQSLFLKYVKLSDATLKCLLSFCPELDDLTLFEINGPTHIQLSNPKLKYLYIRTAEPSSFITPVCCKFALPDPLGFRCLTILIFINVTLSDETLASLLSSCPELEKLTLVEIEDLTYIKLFNPKLKYLDIWGNLFINTCHEDLKNVVSATFVPKDIIHPDGVEHCNFGHVLCFLLGVEELCLGDYFLQSLPFLGVPRRLPSTFYQLTTIDVTINVNDRKEILGAICLLNSSPNLQELFIQLRHNRLFPLHHSVDLQEVEDHFESSFDELLVVTINNFVGTEVDLAITKFILANSSVLERMQINHSVEDTIKFVTLSRELLRFKRASPQAEVEF